MNTAPPESPPPRFRHPNRGSSSPQGHQVRSRSVDYVARLVLDGATLNQDRHPDDLPPEVEAVLLAVWRRVVREGGGPELTLPEAAVLLGTSVESVRRRIKAGKIAAFHDRRGRVRVRASIPESASVEVASPNLTEIWNELKSAKQNLAAAHSEAEEMRQELGMAHFHRREAQQELDSLQNEAAELRDELKTTREQLNHTQRELASMWRVMSSRSDRVSLQLAEMTNGNEAFDLPGAREGFESERSRIQNQITRVRDLSKRRRWPWPQAS